jgi:ADP-heptose:LPS heptosyltransferase
MKLGTSLRKKHTGIKEIVRRATSRIDYFLWLLLDPTKFKKIKKDRIKKILSVLIGDKTMNLGGNFCTLGVLNYFREKNPEIEVCMLVDKFALKQFGEVPGIRFVEYKREETLEDLKKEGFDALLSYDLGDLKMTDFLWIPYRVSRLSSNPTDLFRFSKKMFVTRKINSPWKTHMVESRFKMLESLGFKFEKKELKFHFSKEESSKVESFLKEKKIEKFIILHPGGKFVVEALEEKKWPPHLWPFERYAEVADFFSEKGYKILVTGTKKESILAEKINEKSKTKITNCCGKFSIRETGVLINYSNALIATDTSIVHIAYQLKTPILELMGPSYPEMVGAWPSTSEKNKILFDNGPCAKSMKKTHCPDGRPCMNNISVKDVIDNTLSLLNQ